MEYQILWSMRGRVLVEAESGKEARDKFWKRAELLPAIEDGDCDGYEVDEVEEWNSQ
tara:strand:- start:151 stop:321 length:171 start_codon:yes stop_codon:yes gene_type:complete